ncbi:DUF502 domain-containing protein [Aurantimonas sp. HBX-1]|uniref:DUF502 domain-containing protein n=1 Tax=Aurantimonas sp. HBX-1 TaxID=2906072 RepID=UPI001F3C8C8C|nr:DUF502 domain-containing protein [Aurantimonas sp. HBX-1]UIJ73939.1 DUF502 domain-containing protein [Aurantimonas sp. HBX-1]
MESVKRNIIAGILTLIPVVVTIWILNLVITTLIGFGRPMVLGLAFWAQSYSPPVANLLRADVFQSVLALALVLVGLYVLGALTQAVLGRKVISLVNRTIERLPFVRSLYSSVRRMLEVFQSTETSMQRVVLIRFPNPGMRTLGFVTRTFADAGDPERLLAAVYVPTAPNPTSGFIEIVPVDDLTYVDWTADEAMQFVVSAGATAPERVPFSGTGAEPVTLP